MQEPGFQHTLTEISQMKEKALYHRFLNLLDVQVAAPSMHHLTDLISAHLSVIPFENISKLYNRDLYRVDGIPSLEQYLDGISQHHFGGTCYANNYCFYRLLGFLGYDVKLCAADMKNPGVHMVVLVTIDEKEYLVDVGYAAPFKHPVPLDLKADYTIRYGRDEYHFRPRDGNGFTQMVMLRNGAPKHGYLVRPEARNIDDFTGVILESYRPDSTFFRSLLLTKFNSGRFCILHNMQYTESTPTGSTSFELESKDELVALVESRFQIPGTIAGKVLFDLDLSGDAWD
jgi:N-hydroxyarylamine O-acetyltransferase